MSTLKVTAEFYERFFSYVHKGVDNPCWLWRGTVGGHGYGVINSRDIFGKQLQLAHRVSFWMYKGAVPKGLELDHLCKNKLCVNPQHLQAVPPIINLRRGRRAKLTGTQVREIRARYLPGITSQTELAKEFGVHPAHISRLVNKKLWKKFHARFERE